MYNFCMLLSFSQSFDHYFFITLIIFYNTLLNCRVHNNLPSWYLDMLKRGRTTKLSSNRLRRRPLTPKTSCPLCSWPTIKKSDWLMKLSLTIRSSSRHSKIRWPSYRFCCSWPISKMIVLLRQQEKKTAEEAIEKLKFKHEDALVKAGDQGWE